MKKNLLVFILSTISLTVFSQNANSQELIKKGNKVFVEIADEDARGGEEYFVRALKEWNYWLVAENLENADFIIQLNLDKKAMGKKTSWAVLKEKNGNLIKTTKKASAHVSAFNGYNPFRASVDELVYKILKKEFR
jgi:hypothetical protein